MPTFTNGVLRNRPRVNVTRGYTGNEPGNITLSTTLDSSSVDNLAPATTVYSGQPVELKSDGTFTRPDENTAAESIYIAYHDSTDTDVTSSGKLLGFSALGNFEIETAWADHDALAVGSKIGVDDTGLTLSAIGQNSAAKSIGVVTEIRDLGVAGHTAANPRGGVLNTIPEDSTANEWSDGSVSAAATAQDLDVTVAASNNTDTFTITLTLPSGTSVVTAPITASGTVATDAGAINTALGLVINANSEMDGAIISTGVNAAVVDIQSHAGAANAVVATLQALTGSGTSITSLVNTPGADATTASAMKIVKFVTNV